MNFEQKSTKKTNTFYKQNKANNPCIFQDKRQPKLAFLTLSSNRVEIQITSEQIKELIGIVEKTYDYILIDSPAGIDSGFLNAIECANENERRKEPTNEAQQANLVPSGTILPFGSLVWRARRSRTKNGFRAHHAPREPELRDVLGHPRAAWF